MSILSSSSFSKENIVRLLQTENENCQMLYEKAAVVKSDVIGDKVFFRGLIEFSNICSKNCYYCGIRRDNPDFTRYNLTDEEIIEAANFAYENNFASIVLQSGELNSVTFSNRIELLLKKIWKLTGGKLRVTLSLGEQNEETYKRWFDAGAHRYLLRIETSNPELYSKLHPNNELHSFKNRIKALNILKNIGFQVGTGVMIGLPFQTIEDLATDLLFMKEFGIDMVGMGPYIEHTNTPLYTANAKIYSPEKRFELGLKMIAVLRLLMPSINIAAATALQAIDKLGREKAIKAGANVIMPNITPGIYRDNYLLYQNKPCTDDSAEDCKNCLEVRVALTDNKIAYGEWGDSLYYKQRNGEINSRQTIC